MRGLMAFAVVALGILAALVQAAPPEQPVGGRRAEVTVVVPRGTKPFVVRQDDVVRLTGEGIAGATITAKVNGPAKLDRTNFVQRLQGGQPVIGVNLTEFEVRPTGTGKVTVTVKVENPTGGEPKTTRYEFTVE